MFKIITIGLLVTVALQANHIKVFFANDFKDETSKLQPFQKWYKGTDEQKYSLNELYKDGWKIGNVTKTNASAREWQMTFFMEISNKDYKKVKSKYETKKVKENKTVSAEEGL